MFDKLGFKPATDDYYKLENSLIDQVNELLHSSNNTIL